MTEPQLQVIRLISGDKYVSNHALTHLALHWGCDYEWKQDTKRERQETRGSRTEDLKLGNFVWCVVWFAAMRPAASLWDLSQKAKRHQVIRWYAESYSALSAPGPLWKLTFAWKAFSWADILTCHLSYAMYHTDISTKHGSSHCHYMFMTWLSYWEVEGMVVESRRLQSQWLQSETVIVKVWKHWIRDRRVVSVTPLDIFKETLLHFPAISAVTKQLLFSDRKFRNFQLCFWRPKREFCAKTCFQNPNQVFFCA